MRILIGKLLLRTLLVFFLISTSLEFDPEDNYLIDCGSIYDTSVDDGRVFMADSLNSSVLFTPERIFVNTSSSSNSIPVPSTTTTTSTSLALFRTARIFNGVSEYNFPIKKKGWHWIRLYFFPFSSGEFNLSTARFTVSAQNFTLLKDFQPSSVPVVKEFSVNVTTNNSNLVLKFTPSEDSFGFLNALEIISLPDELIPVSVKTVGPHGRNQNLETQALETVVRVNMGNETVFPRNDTLWRLWLSDHNYLMNPDLVEFVSNVALVNYTKGGGGEEATDNIGPPLVYGTATKLRSKWDPNTQINVTWLFNVDPGFEYFVRFHFCNLLTQPVLKDFFFNVFLNSDFAAKDLNLSTVGAPEYKDVIARPNNGPQIRISIGPSPVLNVYPDGILNGLEIMKISNSGGSLAAADAEIRHSTSTSKFKIWMIVCLAAGLSLILVVSVFVFIVMFRRRNRALVTHSTPEHCGQNSVQSKHYEDSSIFSRSKMGYRFPFVAVHEATDNFSENLVIGVGGFGKVYKGVLRDGTKVAVKRGVTQSSQGLSEFKTEIEMLSQFRHRHLVSLIGYCDEKNEMIIIYEFMEKGTLKDHLCGSDHPKLNWRQRLEICIGSARGLHYLHTGSAKPIIHRDVKSANILLDENLMAKVADFGISKTGPDIDINQTHVSTAVKGSFGYLDPEYLTMQQLTEKSDVYSFGVVMLEILGGRPVIDPTKPREMVNLVEWAMKCSERGELVENFIDSHIATEIRPESLMKFKETAEKCLAERGIDRPTMGDVLWNLECALQLQGSHPMSPEENNHQEISTVTAATEISMGSLGDLAGVSMSKVFSQLVKNEPS